MYRQVLEESDGELNKAKQKEKKLLETEELSFHLQSGLVLCKLAVRIVPTAAINVDSLQVRIASSFSSPTSSFISRLATWWPRGRISLSSWQQLLPMEYQNTFSSDQMIWPFRHTSTSNIAHLFTGYDLLFFSGWPAHFLPLPSWPIRTQTMLAQSLILTRLSRSWWWRCWICL